MQDGTELPLLEGDVELRNVTFAYPTRPDCLILKHFDLMIPKGRLSACISILFIHSAAWGGSRRETR